MATLNTGSASHQPESTNSRRTGLPCTVSSRVRGAPSCCGTPSSWRVFVSVIISFSAWGARPVVGVQKVSSRPVASM